MGWPVAWLQEMISVEEFDRWCEFHMRYPIDDQSNHHMPIADLHKSFVNSREGAEQHPMKDFLLFRKQEPEEISDVDQAILSGKW